jgi:hypothetical protein
MTIESPFSWVFLPGIGLYVLLNGTLLFGGGFGKFGDFLVIGVGSAFAWSIPAAAFFAAVAWMARRRRK